MIPNRIGPYQVTGVLGQGGAGIVYSAVHPHLGNLAIKVLRAGRSSNEGQRERFRRETAALRKLDHPNVVRLLDAGEERGVPWLAMSRVVGESLGDRLHRGGPLPIEEVIQIGVSICNALEVVHQEGLLHRDLKPDNVLHSVDGRILLTDFGLVKDLEVEESVVLRGRDTSWGPPATGRPSWPWANAMPLGRLPTSMEWGRLSMPR